MNANAVVSISGVSLVVISAKTASKKMGKGTDGERELVTWLWEHGYATLRAPGSGSIDRPSPDVIAINPTKGPTIVVELKASSDGTANFKQAEVNELVQWAERAGGEPYLAVKPDMRSHDNWYFKWAYDAHRTKSNNFSIRQKDHEDCLSREDVFL